MPISPMAPTMALPMTNRRLVLLTGFAMAPTMALPMTNRLVLLTGFAAFDHKTKNPSGEVAGRF